MVGSLALFEDAPPSFSKRRVRSGEEGEAGQFPGCHPSPGFVILVLAPRTPGSAKGERNRPFVWLVAAGKRRTMGPLAAGRAGPQLGPQWPPPPRLTAGVHGGERHFLHPACFFRREIKSASCIRSDSTQQGSSFGVIIENHPGCRRVLHGVAAKMPGDGQAREHHSSITDV